MLRSIIILTSYIYFTTNPIVSADDGDHPWCYIEDKCDPSKWDGLCKSGRSQSPVDIDPELTIELKQLKSLSISKDYYKIHSDFYIKNNGHTIQVQLNEETTSTLLLETDGITGAFQFSQIHFHWGSSDDKGSEHKVFGSSYALEAHLVHFSDQYENILEAVSDQNPKSLAVFAIFFQVSMMDNPILNPIIEALGPVIDYHPDPLLNKMRGGGGLNFSTFFPDVLDIYRYQGSLTTPSCGEKVIWTVFRRPLAISKKQLDAFRNVKDNHGFMMINNYRPTQPLSGRMIYNGTLQLSELIMDRTNEVDHDDNNPIDNSIENNNGNLTNHQNTKILKENLSTEDSKKNNSQQNHHHETSIFLISILFMISSSLHTVTIS